MRLSELQPPATIEWTRYRDNRCEMTGRARIVSKLGRNLKTEQGDYLWWPTINYYGDVRVVSDTDLPTCEDLFKEFDSPS